MKKLYLKSLSRLVNELQLPNKKLQLLSKHILLRYPRDVNYTRFYRLPTSEVKTMLKTPCLLKRTSREKPSDLTQKIKVFKRLRHEFHVDQKSVCNRCPFAPSCKLRNVELDNVESSPTGIHDFLYFFLSLKRHIEAGKSQLRLLPAYIVIESFNVMIKDYDMLKEQSFLYYQILEDEKAREKRKFRSKVSKEEQEKLQTAAKLAKRTVFLSDKPPF